MESSSSIGSECFCISSLDDVSLDISDIAFGRTKCWVQNALGEVVVVVEVEVVE